EQCWHRVPGGTAVAALALARALLERDDVGLIGVAGRHAEPPAPPYAPPLPVQQLPLASPWLYETWHRLRWPPLERATGRVDVAHATTLAIPPTRAPLVVTVHDLAFLHQPDHFTRHGLRFFHRGMALAKRHATLVLCSSQATFDDCCANGFDERRLRLVPLGVDVVPADAERVAELRRTHGRYVFWSGTIEPRKNLRRLLEAFERVAERHDEVRLVLAGPQGWNEELGPPGERVTVLGFVPDDELRALYSAAAVSCYPSLMEGFGLPVLEAMAQGTPVVTSAGTSTAELAEGGAALTVDPFDVAAIADAIGSILDDAELAARLAEAGRRRAADRSWARTADITVAAYAEATA
ncbi:MAG TPA: glycosyltransferase family 1 protein, partial [Acidimicrobiales bacterium]|nr:glycosyltransferase family 1 protein [Acidimicrobiales bacterium]